MTTTKKPPPKPNERDIELMAASIAWTGNTLTEEQWLCMFADGEDASVLSQKNATYIAAVSPDVVLRLLDMAEMAPKGAPRPLTRKVTPESAAIHAAQPCPTGCAPGECVHCFWKVVGALEAQLAALEARLAAEVDAACEIKDLLAEAHGVIESQGREAAEMDVEIAEARGMALTEVTDLLRNVLSRSLVSATEKLIVEVILDKIEALKAGAR